MLLEALSALKEEKRRNELLAQWNRELRVRLFGRKSEELSEENQRLLDFIIEGTAALKSQPRPEPPPPPPERKGHGRTRIPAGLPRDLIVHDVPPQDRRCRSCRKEMVLIGREETERVEYVPASIHVKKDVRLKYGCADAECRGQVVLADLPAQAVPKSKAAEGMMAFVAASKYAHHLPLYRLEEILANQGYEVHRSTLWEWLKGAAEAFEPVVAEMKRDIQSSGIVETDETPVALRDREQGGMRTGRQWTYVNERHTVFDFSRDRKREHPKRFLESTKGTILSDAYSGYRSIAEESGGRLTNAFCLAHLRRLFFKALGSDKERSLVGMAYIRALYQVEARAKDLSASRRLKLRQRESRLVLDKFMAWLTEEGMAVLPKSPIGKAIAYARRHWKGLTRFLENGNLRVDNNRSEQQIRLVAVGRRNWLRYESERGGRVGAVFTSLVASCRRHRKNPFEYFRDVLRRIADHPMRKIRDLTPARWKPKPDTS